MATIFWATAAFAQPQPARIGILGPDEEPRFSELVGGLKQGLNDHGYTASSLEILEARVTRGDQAGARSAVEGLMRRQVKMLFVIGSELAKLARQVSSEIQIVFVTPGDPVTAIIPRAKRVVIIYDPRDASPMQGIAVIREVAPSFRVTLDQRGVRNREELTGALAALNKAQGLLAIPGGFPSSHYEEIIRAAHAKRVTTMFHTRSGSTMDALASYGANDVAITRQAARLVDKILKGEKAGEIPVERPMKLEFVINLKAAKQIGMTVPPNVLVRADRVIR